MSMVRPKFLTKEIAALATETAIQIMGESPISNQFKRQACHIVILVPEMEDDSSGWPEWPLHKTRAHALYERSYGDRSDWRHDYDEIARCKALQLWHDRNDGGTNVMPHLLFPGDTPNWGGVKRDGIVVACSGVQPHFDRMLSGIIADICIGLAYEAWMTSDDLKNKVDFLT